LKSDSNGSDNIMDWPLAVGHRSVTKPGARS
jgi:hypothetical protein